MRSHIRVTLLLLVLGTGLPTAASSLSISASHLDFGNELVGQTTALQSVVMTNDGSVPVIILGLSLIGADPADFIVSADLSSALGPGASRQLNVWFMPTAAGGRTAEVIVSGVDATTLATLGLSGVGVVPEPAVGMLLALGLTALVPWRGR